MTTEQVLATLRSGASLHMEHDQDGEMVFWLEPKRRIVRRDIALKIVGGGHVMAERDSLFDGVLPQTWRAA